MFLFSLSEYPEVELLDRMVVLFLIFEAPPYCFPWWLHQFTLLPTVHEGSLFFTSLPTLVSCLFDDSHYDRCELISHCAFDFPDD